MDGRRRVVDGFSHRPQAPMRRASRRRLQGQPDRLGDLVIADLARPARPRLVVKPVETLFGETPPPLADRVLHRPNRSEERRVGNEGGSPGRARGSLYHEKKKKNSIEEK